MITALEYWRIYIFRIIKRLMGRQKKEVSKPVTIDPIYIIPRSEHSISRADISDNALKVLRRLSKAGFQAHLVGGSVRDLLLRHVPKDFDVATDAHPEEVRKLFRNCRLIGRRFRLAHILFGKDIVEVATFRAEHSGQAEEHRHDESGMIMRDNIYGTLHEDAWRRDFTINALYYDISNFSVIDLTGGMADVHAKLVRIIGDPHIRYQEDPVRMIRAVRFASKLSFTIEEKTLQGIEDCSSYLDSVSSSRMFDELLKMFHSGHAVACFQSLRKYHLLEKVLPQTSTALEKDKSGNVLKMLLAVMQNTDSRIHETKPVTPAFLFAALLWHPLLEEAEKLREHDLPPLIALEKAMSHVVRQQNYLSAIPKRLSSVMREIWLLQYRFPRRQGRRAYRLLDHPRFRAAYDFLLMRIEAGEEKPELGTWWTEFQFATPETQKEMTQKFMHRPGVPARKARTPSFNYMLHKS